MNHQCHVKKVQQGNVFLNERSSREYKQQCEYARSDQGCQAKRKPGPCC